MKAQTKKVALCMVAVIVTAFVLVQTVQAASIGPLPPLKFNAKKSGTGKETLFRYQELR